MTDRLYGRATSVNVQKVMWALAELGLAHERIDVGGKHGGTDDPAFVAMNPNRRVPVWQEAGLTLWESHVILRHLARREGALEPGPVGDQWMEFVTGTLQPPFIACFFQTVRLPVEKRSADRLQAAVASLDAATAILDQTLQQHEWLNGEAFSVADIAAGSLMYRYHDMAIPRPDRPGLDRWCKALAARPAYRQTIETDYSDLAGA